MRLLHLAGGAHMRAGGRIPFSFSIFQPSFVWSLSSNSNKRRFFVWLLASSSLILVHIYRHFTYKTSPLHLRLLIQHYPPSNIRLAPAFQPIVSQAHAELVDTCGTEELECWCLIQNPVITRKTAGKQQPAYNVTASWHCLGPKLAQSVWTFPPRDQAFKHALRLADEQSTLIRLLKEQSNGVKESLWRV
ncbi:uncharacterized protein B0T15DRAFT_304570 [Chaetomium strumarium]|uniref:Uncharacterized protein n=1 Tax=Chaetomium strumarium TaxID=1170767 RepID=A0AAJ0GMF6_9PEZI|nr:hypothetical protein B0T15DRAFT_304570 [Chaetomium strumarium]